EHGVSGSEQPLCESAAQQAQPDDADPRCDTHALLALTGGWATGTFAGLRAAHDAKKRREAMRAPSVSARNSAQTTSSATRPIPAEVSNPQSVPASTQLGSPMVAATRSM